MAGGSKIDESSVDLGGSGFGDYELVVRNFIASDKPHLPLPYNTITRHKTISSNLANLGIVNVYSFDEVLAGTYTIGLLFRFVSTTNFMNKLDEGIRFSYYVGGTQGYYFQEGISSKFIQPVYTGTQYVIHHYFYPTIPLPTEASPSCTIHNGSGTNLAVYLTVLALELS